MKCSTSLLATALFALAGFALSAPLQGADEKAIGERLGKLRQLPDTDRAVEQKALALEIRRLEDPGKRLALAQSLAYVSTEGDFGRDTLQTVADTLIEAIKSAPENTAAERLAGAFMFAAQLAKYEDMAIWLDLPGYRTAQAELDRIDAARASADFELKDLSGKSWTLSALKGKVVLVNFWATWCPPCRKEMPDLEELSKQFKDQGLVVLAISDEEDAKVRPFIAEHGYSFNVLLDPGRTVSERYFVDGIPKNFVFDRDGKLVAQSMDMRTRKQFLALLAKAGLHENR